MSFAESIYLALVSGVSGLFCSRLGTKCAQTTKFFSRYKAIQVFLVWSARAIVLLRASLFSLWIVSDRFSLFSRLKASIL